MITLITGGPGTGKTAWLLDQLVNLRKNEPDKLLYIHGVRNLRGLPHETIYCHSQLCDICRAQKIPDDARFVENWPEWKETGSLIIVDEVQRIWRPRTGGAIPHESVNALETHRHYGLDFWLISQGPHLFDNFIRLLVGRHIHLVSRWNGRTQYEWPECKQDVQSRTDAVIRPYKLPSRVFKLYDSAELHTKQDKRKPLSFYAMIIAVLLMIALFYGVYSRIQAHIPAKETIVSKEGGGDAQAAPSPSIATNTLLEINKTTFPDFKPVIEGVPESAPAYSGIVKVTVAPLLAGCLYSKSKDKCTCYTVQATEYPTSKLYCMEVIQNHRFNPYSNPVTVSKSETNHELAPPMTRTN